MSRRRLKLAYIENNSRRKACYKKRKKGLMKKVEELSTLCGVQACAIIYSPFDEEPQIWPPSHSAVQDVLKKFKDLSVIEQNRKMLSQEDFTRQRISKLQEQCKKLSRENRQKEIKLFVSQCLAGEARGNFSLADLNEMRWSIYFSMEKISRQIETVKSQSLLPPPAPTEPMMPGVPTSGVVMATIQTEGGGNGYEPEVEPEMLMNDSQNPPWGLNTMMPKEQSAGFDNGYDPAVAPEMPMNYSQNPSSSMSTMVQNEQFAGFDNGYNPVVAPEIPMDYSQNPTWGMNVIVQNRQSADFGNGYELAVPAEMTMNYFENPTWGMNMRVQNEQFAGIGNGYDPAVAPGMPMNYSQNPTQGMSIMVPNEQSAGFGNGYDVAFPPEMPMNDPQNLTPGMNAMVPLEQCAGFGNGYDVAFAPEMPMNDPQNLTPGMNTMVPLEPSAGSGDFDWISYLFGDDGAGPSFTSP